MSQDALTLAFDAAVYGISFTDEDGKRIDPQSVSLPPVFPGQLTLWTEEEA